MGKKGKCVNIDCDNYKKEIEIETGGEMECPLCHQPLKPVDEKGGKHNTKGSNGGNKKVIIGVLAALVLGGGACGYLAMGTGDAEKVGVDSVETAGQESVSAMETSKDSVVSPISEPVADSVVTAEPKSEPAPASASASQEQVQNGRGTVELGYGTYTGDLKNGKPHGYGVLTYKKAHKIVASKDFVANAGDTFEGDFRDGKISGMGYWKHGGNTTVVKP